MPSTTSSCVTPNVATVITMRGALRKRRMIAISMTNPSNTAISIPTPRPIKYGHCQNRMSAAANPVGTVPRSAWAKLTTRLAR